MITSRKVWMSGKCSDVCCVINKLLPLIVVAMTFVVFCVLGAPLNPLESEVRKEKKRIYVTVFFSSLVQLYFGYFRRMVQLFVY